MVGEPSGGKFTATRKHNERQEGTKDKIYSSKTLPSDLLL
jgi:hypothetical protein